jgi:hypothetical protein
MCRAAREDNSGDVHQSSAWGLPALPATPRGQFEHGIAQHAAGCRDASCQLRRTNGCRFPRPYDDARSAIFTGVQFDADSSVLGDLAGSEFDTVWHWDLLL